MKKSYSKIAKAVLYCVLLFSFVFAPVDFSLLVNNAQGDEDIEYISGPVTWGTGETHTFNKDVTVTSSAFLTIEPGVTIKFGEKSDGKPINFLVNGIISANGTHDLPIKFTKDDPSSGFVLTFDNSSNAPLLLRYVEVMDGGGHYEIPHQANAGKIKFTNSALAQETYDIIYYPAVDHKKGKVHFENSRFISCGYADARTSMVINGSNKDKNLLEIANSNFEFGLNHTAVISKMTCLLDDNDECKSKLFLKNNWYGDPSGPNTNDDPYKIGGKIEGEYYKLSGWRTKTLIADPVIIIPGITGSAEVDGVWEMDPNLHSYDDLLEAFERNGYIRNVNLFEFPYDWRKSNVETAMGLGSKISEILQNQHVSKIDLVSHSMGGLVARHYIQNNPYAGFLVDQLITLGTPHLGSPKSYLKWEAGEGFISLFDKIAKWYFKREAKHNGYNDIFSYIRGAIPSVSELLPIYDYLYDVEENRMRDYPNENYPQNTFLNNLSNPESVAKLASINFVNIIGNLGNENSTIGEIKVVPSTIEGKWEHGMPEKFEEDETFGLVYVNGDETVSYESSTGVSADKTPEINSSHRKLPTKAQCIVISELTALTEDECSYEDNPDIDNILGFNVLSPVDIQVVNSNNERVGKDFATGQIVNEIEDAYYSGFGTINEMITIPNPDGEYQIIARGTPWKEGEDGTYTIEVSKITEDGDSPEGASEVTLPISGTAVEDQDYHFAVKVDNQAVGDDQLQLVPEEAVTTDSIIADVNGYWEAGQIKNYNLWRTLLIKLVDIKRHEEIRERFPEGSSGYNRNKAMIIRDVDFLVEGLTQLDEKWIDEEARTSLIESLQDFKKTFSHS